MDINTAKKPKGKFLKKDSPLMDKVKITKFNFAEIRSVPILYADNPYNNIYYKDYQNEEDLEKGLKSAKKVFEDLQDKIRPGIIFPRDFTGDWLEEKRKARKRSAHKDIDDDEFEMALEEEERSKTDESNSDENINVENQDQSGNNDVKIEANPSLESKEDLKSLQQVDNISSFEDMGKAIKHFSGHKPSDTEAESNNEPSIMPPPQEQPQQLETPTPTSSDDMMVSNHQAIQNLGSDIQNTENESQVQESDLMTTKQDISDPVETELNPQNIEAIKNDAFLEGVQSGRNEIEAESANLIKNLHENFEQLKGLKKNILESAQSNFEEISSAISEALIGKAINLDPKIFKKIIDKAIEENIDHDDYHVKVHPDMLAALKNDPEVHMSEQWQEDSNIEKGKFEIESKDTKVKSNLKDLISSMLNNVDISLFDESDVENPDSK